MAVVLKKLRSAMEEKGMGVAEFPSCEDFTVSIIRLVISMTSSSSIVHLLPQPFCSY